MPLLFSHRSVWICLAVAVQLSIAPRLSPWIFGASAVQWLIFTFVLYLARPPVARWSRSNFITVICLLAVVVGAAAYGAIASRQEGEARRLS